MNVEVSAATEFIEIFLGRQPRQHVKVLVLSNNQPRPEDGDGVSYRNFGKT